MKTTASPAATAIKVMTVIFNIRFFRGTGPFCRRFLPKKIGKLPVKKLVETPFPADSGELLNDGEFLNTLQNIHCQYQIYGKSSL